MTTIAALSACSDDGSDSDGGGGNGGGGSGGAAGSGAAAPGTGGSSGGGTGAMADTGGASSPATCPPNGPFGSVPGEVAPNVILYDCEGNEVQLHDLCGLDAAFIYTFAGWCPTCKSFASSDKPNEIYAKYKDESFDMWFVVTAPASPGTPTQDTCATYRDQYGLQMNVLYDPEGATQSLLGMRINSGELVLSNGAVIEINTTGVAATESTLQSIFGY
ncbi:MAG: peroxiredoxin family protein [Myxococcota bacterium]